jgi:hypothetical protein
VQAPAKAVRVRRLHRAALTPYRTWLVVSELGADARPFVRVPRFPLAACAAAPGGRQGRDGPGAAGEETRFPRAAVPIARAFASCALSVWCLATAAPWWSRPGGACHLRSASRAACASPTLRLPLQEAALEGLLDLVRQPGFVHDLFVNCDCRVERANLFEEVRKRWWKGEDPTPERLRSCAAEGSRLLSARGRA